MRMILVGLSAALLAGCNTAAVTNNGSSNATAAPANGAAPAQPPINPENMVLPGGEEDAGGPANSSAPAGSANGNRAELLEECTSQGRAMLPQGTDVAALCGCAVDRHLAGTRRNEAMRQCATEQDVRLPGQ